MVIVGCGMSGWPLLGVIMSGWPLLGVVMSGWSLLGVVMSGWSLLGEVIPIISSSGLQRTFSLCASSHSSGISQTSR